MTEQFEKLEPFDQTGTTFGRYHVRRKIGEGAMARVFEAYDPATDRRIALKVLKPSLRSDDALVSRFLNEARASGGLDHPHIVACFDVDIKDDVPYITMELVEGPSLEDILAKENSTDLALTVEHLCQIALALDHAHQAGRIHRDIKPSNILLTPDLKTAKIADFGIARIEQTDLTAATSLGEFIGTPRYSSPEQLDGVTIDGRSDLFSFGAVAYEILTAQKAFPATTISSLFAQITNEIPSRVREIRPDIPPAMAAAVEKLLAKSPNDRWQTGTDFANVLRQIVSEGGKETVTPRLPWLIGGLVAVGSIAVAIVIASMATDPTDEQTSKDYAEVPAARIDKANSTSPKVGDFRTVYDIEPSAPPFRAPPPPTWPANWRESWLQHAVDNSSDNCYWLENVSSGPSPGLTAITDNSALHQRTLAEFSAILGSANLVVDQASSDSSMCSLANALAGQALPAPRRMIDITPPSHQLYEGDTFELSITPPANAGHITLFHIDSNAMVSELFAADDQSWWLFMEHGQIKVKSDAEDGRWQVYRPLGTEVLFVLATNASARLSIDAPQPLGMFLGRLIATLAQEEGTWHLASLLQFETLPR